MDSRLPSPEDFTFDHPPRRIMGSETEYNINIPNIDGSDVADAVESVLDGLRPHSKIFISDYHLRNGGRMYIDCGTMLEYATPEVTSAYDLMRYEYAGMPLVDSIARKTSANARAYRRTGYDHIVDNPASAGYHENYCVNPQTFNTEDYVLFASYLASRGIWAGAGIVGEKFRLAQKAHGIGMIGGDAALGVQFNVTYHGQKPLLWMRPDSHPDWARLEVRGGDANMSPWATVTKFAMSSLLLRIIEHKHQLPPLDGYRLAKPITAMHNISSDYRFRALYHTYNNDSTLTAIEHQRHLAELGLELAESIAAPQEETRAAEDIISVCDRLQTDDLEVQLGALAGKIDWAAKLLSMTELGVPIEAINRTDSRAVMKDLTWEDANLYGPAHRWYRSAQPHTDITPIKLERLQQLAPRTRAMARVALIQMHDTQELNDNVLSMHPYDPELPVSMTASAWQ